MVKVIVDTFRFVVSVTFLFVLGVLFIIGCGTYMLLYGAFYAIKGKSPKEGQHVASKKMGRLMRKFRIILYRKQKISKAKQS